MPDHAAAGLPERITLVSRGGIGGLTLPPLVLDTAPLASEIKARLASLCASAADVAGGAASPVVDAMHQQVTLDYGKHSVTVSGADGGGSPAFEALCDLVRAQADR